MSTSRSALIALVVVLGTALAVPAAGQAPPTCSVTTSWSLVTIPPNPPTPVIYASIGAALGSAPAPFLGGTVFVSGDCTEPEVGIGERFINLLVRSVGSTQATLHGTSPGGAAIAISGRSITVQGLRIMGAGAETGVTVLRGGTAVIDRCVIEGFTIEGISVVQHAFARIVNNTLQNNGAEGILVHENSMARIGFRSVDASGAPPSGNTIRNNGGVGIRVNRTSSARMTGNVVTDNGDAGIVVENGSHADIAWNDLSGNHGAGVRLHLNSSARLGFTGAVWNVPNSTNAPNFGAGVECTLGGAVEGTLGTLTGVEGQQKFGRGCMHDFTP